MTSNKNIDPRSKLPAVSDLLHEKSIQSLIGKYSRLETLNAIDKTLRNFREKLGSGENYPGDEKIISAIKKNMSEMHKQDLRTVVNATGIILHTGLGRAVLPESASETLSDLKYPCNLQIDLKTGKRGKRHFRTEQLLGQITGAEAAHIVNNNAAATLLILATFCKDQEIIISRGQMIEIGGSYRLPDCIHQSGAKMVEVGTTNKTHLYDYKRALTENTAAILHVNPSNYHIQGFSEQVSIKKLAELKKEQPFLLIDDLGCGALMDMRELDLPYE
ncbi:MAG TPA: L-seryl-tRNA(Sec) selenium transferase, partial [bacterium]|nr:L-seryl-tRNA(Sec) selenium transferase [bacterium]